MSEPVFTIIAPIYNELENLPLLYARVSEVMNQTGKDWELILVDDGSSDGSTESIRKLASQDTRVRPVIFARNFGHQIAVTAGMDYSRGQAVVIIDSDLQDPPEVILELIEKWREGYQVVYAVRTEREGESWFKLTTASLFYKLIYKITDVKMPLNTGDFRLIEYKRAARHAGQTHYPLKKMIRLAMNAVTGFSTFPLQMLTTGGVALVALSLLLLLVYLGLAIFNGFDLTYVLATWLTMIFLAGVLLIGMGVLGEYIGRIYDEAKGRPLYIVAEGPDKSLDSTRLDREKEN